MLGAPMFKANFFLSNSNFVWSVGVAFLWSCLASLCKPYACIKNSARFKTNFYSNLLIR